MKIAVSFLKSKYDIEWKSIEVFVLVLECVKAKN